MKGTRREPEGTVNYSSTEFRSSLPPKPSSLSPLKRLGQNFLVDPGPIKRLISSLRLVQGETIIEIGPGHGALTAPLLDVVGRVIAVEFDRNLIPLLLGKFGSRKNFTLIESDALVTDFCDLIRPATQARIVANLPYNISTAILQRLIEQRYCLTEITLILQKEVVERIRAVPGSKYRGFISVLVEAYYTSEKLFDIAPRASKPAPKVWSSVVRLTLKPKLKVAPTTEKLLWQIVSAGFAQRRKTILNNLRRALLHLQETVRAQGGAANVLSRAHVSSERRAETLSLEEWVRIATVLDDNVTRL